MLLLGDRAHRAGRWVALLTAAATFGISIPLYTGFDTSTAPMQFVEQLPWIPALQLDLLPRRRRHLAAADPADHVHHGAGGHRAWTVDREAPGAVLRRLPDHGRPDDRRVRALDALLFYFFWEAMLIPMFLIIGVWGGPRRVYATIKFFLYTFLGSRVHAGRADLHVPARRGELSASRPSTRCRSTLTSRCGSSSPSSRPSRSRCRCVPVHTWLPDAHVEAPTGGSVVLAAIMLKMGGYGFLRFTLPITPDASASSTG